MGDYTLYIHMCAELISNYWLTFRKFTIILGCQENAQGFNW